MTEQSRRNAETTNASGWIIRCDACGTAALCRDAVRFFAIKAFEEAGWVLTAAHGKEVEFCPVCAAERRKLMLGSAAQ